MSRPSAKGSVRRERGSPAARDRSSHARGPWRAVRRLDHGHRRQSARRVLVLLTSPISASLLAAAAVAIVLIMLPTIRARREEALQE
ncbi:MAG: hypothetical protein EKK33_03200 [Bradyrhizobiaceae bacterium]|nr:MAG: hypothetical protein EKK33_03200 [Bradyrhizobiaceae bacterium]